MNVDDNIINLCCIKFNIYIIYILFFQTKKKNKKLI